VYVLIEWALSEFLKIFCDIYLWFLWFRYLENSKADPLRGGVDDDDSSDGGFKQRIQTSHPITKTVKQIEKTYTTSGFPANDIQTRQSWKYHQKPPALNRTGSSFDSSDHTYEPQMMASPLKRPTRLYFIDNMVPEMLCFIHILYEFYIPALYYSFIFMIVFIIWDFTLRNDTILWFCS
jgi:hypothetical protein